MKRGDHVRYVGLYAPGITYRYPPGTIHGFRNQGSIVTVLLPDGSFADWPADDTEVVAEKGVRS
jgi:mannose-6-phosphate isomerase-like protein (cupin superfamily)